MTPDNYDEFMNASAEEWSKEKAPSSSSANQDTQTNRWGASTSTPQELSYDRWGSQSLDNKDELESKSTSQPITEKKKIPWWVILIAVVTIICVCSVITLITVLGIRIFR